MPRGIERDGTNGGETFDVSDSGERDVSSLLYELNELQAELDARTEELRASREALEQTEAQIADMFSEAPVGFFMIGVQGRILNCNQRAAELMRLSVSTATRRRLTEFMAPEDASTFMHHVAVLYRTKEPVSYQCEMRRSDGKAFWAELTLRLERLEDGMHLCRVAVSDQSDRKRLQDDTARLVAIVESSDHAIISQDMNGVINSWNVGATRLFGYPMAQAIGHNIDVIVPPDQIEHLEAVRARIRRRETVTEETLRVRRDGTRVSVFMSAAPILGINNQVVGVSYFLRDITEQLQARQEVARLLETLRDADRRKDDFIATLAHELRNPLAPIRNAAAVMRYAPELTPKLKWCRDVIDRQVGHMAALLEDLLDVSRLTRDRITLHRDRVELGTALAQAIELNRHLIDERQHELVLNTTPQPIEVFGDLTHLTQIFGNLLSNAAKYTEPGGTISVTTSVAEGHVVVRISDTGIGVDPQNLSSIFELFAQVDPAREQKEGGLGIGLALVKGLVELHGGTVEARSDGLNCGTEFVVTLPVLRPEPNAHPGDHPVVSPVASKRLRVLVVDDNVDAAETMTMMLEAGHHDVRTANDGPGALALAAEFLPQVVVLDIGMPGMNGYDIARRLRETPWGRTIVLIACTGWGQPDDRRRSQEAGFDHHMVKPVSASAMLQLVNAIGDENSG